MQQPPRADPEASPSPSDVPSPSASPRAEGASSGAAPGGEQQHIYMRWKERFFDGSASEDYGLTIAGVRLALPWYGADSAAPSRVGCSWVECFHTAGSVRASGFRVYAVWWVQGFQRCGSKP